jgi:fibronectin type 3 domain-containing protein
MKARLSAFAAVVLVGLCSLVIGCNSDGLTSSSNAAALVAPQNVRVTQNAWGDVIVTWDRNTQSSLRGYNVYRLDVAESSIQRLTGQPIEENHYLDDGAVFENRYEYRVTSVSTRGTESAYVGTVIDVDTPRRGDKLRPER